MDTKTNIIIVDFDDTLCIHGTDKSNIEIGKPNLQLISKLNELFENGYEIHIYTARGHFSAKNRIDAQLKYADIIKTWLKKHNVKYNLLSFNKPYGIIYIDDKAVRPNEIEKLDIL